MSEEEKMWNSICKILEENGEIEISTIRVDNRRGKRFLVKKSANELFVFNTDDDLNSTEIEGYRIIKKEEFLMIASRYTAWNDIIINSKESRKGSLNSSYIFAIVDYLKNNG